MNNNQYMSVIAFMDEDSGIAGDNYLLEFCKIALYQNGYEGMNIPELREAVQKIIPFEYTEEEIDRVIEDLGKTDIIICDEKYELSSNAEKEIRSRDKGFALRKHIDDYCDKFISRDNKVDREKLCDLITNFLFEKFQESIEQILSLLDENSKLALNLPEEYSEEEKRFINDFLIWDNDEKNKMIYRLIVKSYDFCMINCPKKISFDFSDFRFYLDANIVMRLMGINNLQRQDAVKRFVDKCEYVGVGLYVSCYTKIEIEKSIENQLAAIENEITSMGRIQAPSTVQFGFSNSFSIELYRKFYDYCNKKKTRSLNGFRTQILREVEECISRFHYDEDISYDVLEPKEFEILSNSLKDFKDDKDKAVVKTDVNNILLLQNRRKTIKDTYLISADAKLIRWCKDTFIGCNSLVEFPSVWLSIITKYTGRASENDFSAFCKFIRLPIVSKDKDIKRKVNIKIQVESFDVSDQMKDRIIDELNHNYSRYKEFETPDEAAQKAYDKVLADREAAVRIQEQKKHELEIKALQDNYERELAKAKDDYIESENTLKSKIKSVEKQLSEENNNSVHVKIQEWVKSKVENSLDRAEWLKSHRNRIWVILTMIIVIIIGIQFIKKEVNQEVISILSIVIACGIFFLDSFVGKIIDALIERFGNDNEVTLRYKKKAKKKFKDILD